MTPYGQNPVRFCVFVLGLVLAALVSPGFCQTSPAPTAEPVSPTLDAPPPASDPSLPPINCPLRKHGIDPNQLRPFEEVEEYIAFLDNPERDLWQKPDEVVAALKLQGTETVVDLGAGGGYFTFRLARALPEGRVVASDIEPEMVRHIHRKAMTEGVRNVQAELILPGSPMLPERADLVFICDVLLHVQNRAAWTSTLAGEMRSGARLMLIEFREGDLPQGPPESKKIPRKEIIDLFTTAGLTFESEKPDMLPYQVFLEFKKP